MWLPAEKMPGSLIKEPVKDPEEINAYLNYGKMPYPWKMNHLFILTTCIEKKS